MATNAENLVKISQVLSEIFAVVCCGSMPIFHHQQVAISTLVISWVSGPKLPDLYTMKRDNRRYQKIRSSIYCDISIHFGMPVCGMPVGQQIFPRNWSRHITMPNFDEIARSVAEILRSFDFLRFPGHLAFWKS